MRKDGFDCHKRPGAVRHGATPHRLLQGHFLPHLSVSHLYASQTFCFNEPLPILSSPPSSGMCSKPVGFLPRNVDDAQWKDKLPANFVVIKQARKTTKTEWLFDSLPEVTSKVKTALSCANLTTTKR